MLDPQEATRRWKTLRATLNSIKDPILRESFLAEYKERAEKEWGFCPDKSVKSKEYTADMLPPLESLIYAKIQSCKDYGVWEKDEELDRLTFNKMKLFVESGYSYSDLPEHLQCKLMFNLYLDALNSCVDDAINYFAKK